MSNSTYFDWDTLASNPSVEMPNRRASREARKLEWENIRRTIARRKREAWRRSMQRISFRIKTGRALRIIYRHFFYQQHKWTQNYPRYMRVGFALGAARGQCPTAPRVRPSTLDSAPSLLPEQLRLW